VPMTIVSPWTKGGYVCSQVFDHTSIIQFIEKRFGAQYPGITESNVTAWRRAVCGDLTSAFNFATPNDAVPSLPSTAAYLPPNQDRYPDYDPVPPVDQALPKQEPGVRLARALPYALSASGRIDGGAGLFWIDFANTGTVGAQFSVYAANRNDGPWTYTVDAGATVSDYWSAVAVTGGQYELEVFGPNGFYREFIGNVFAATASGAADPEATLAYDTRGNGVTLKLVNNGGKACTLKITSAFDKSIEQVYVLQPGDSAESNWNLNQSFGWYDLQVTADLTDSFVRRYSGHVENGSSSISDPRFGAQK
jgi:phospholipase C